MRYIFTVLSFASLSLSDQIKIPTAFVASFTQNITTPQKKIIRYSGTVLLDSSNKLKWNYKKPITKEVCSDGNFFTVVDHDLEQVSFYKLDQVLDLPDILKRAKHHKDNLYIAQYQDRLYSFLIDLKGRITQIAFKDNLDNVVNIHFQNMHYKDSLMSKYKIECPYPISYDIIAE